ncbi:unknown protein [Microcystis aeruginosa NIES-843]|uniref:Uncharacterized protein n=1 Tax=Microcystis aeruginosa (strain NIES-843 / IAM M-2473) TaxID=449447 RepID=B0JN20_MICAN|nr:unknown protein [Microcystis aeruginosa NIES-843]
MASPSSVKRCSIAHREEKSPPPWLGFPKGAAMCGLSAGNRNISPNVPRFVARKSRKNSRKPIIKGVLTISPPAGRRDTRSSAAFHDPAIPAMVIANFLPLNPTIIQI